MEIKSINRPPTLKQVVIDRLREDICRGHFQSGQPLSEIKVANSINVSRGTIREALLELKDEGLVEFTPHKGFSLTKLSIHKAWEIYSLRALLEPYAARLAVENKAFSSKDIEILTSLVEKLGYNDSKIDYYEKIKADMEFHKIIYYGCNNKLLVNTLKGLQSLTFLFILKTNISQSDRIKADMAHREILNAIKSGSCDKSEELIRKHIVDTGEALVDKMNKDQKKESSYLWAYARGTG